ncbi:hypothetical protein IW262DRAFT_546192 [Armillaria fumosa]|nr:hypothetical protein IW262DRAFT_546192 [Armillaria fumosa]
MKHVYGRYTEKGLKHRSDEEVYGWWYIEDRLKQPGWLQLLYGHHYHFTTTTTTLHEPSSDRNGPHHCTTAKISCSAAQFVAVDVNCEAWLFGRNGSSCLGLRGVLMTTFTLSSPLGSYRVTEGQEKATESGKVYAFSSGEKGQLGNGTTGERIMMDNKTATISSTNPMLL